MTCRSALIRLFLVAVVLVPAGRAGEVTPDRLLHAAAEPSNWLMNLGRYDGARYSGLAGINHDTVDALVVRWSVALGGLVEGGGNYAATLPLSPLVDNGFIYIVDGWGKVSKLDARRQGAVVWDNAAGQHNLDAWLQASRGIALWRGFVIAGSADGRIHWIDAETGETARSVQVGDPREGYTITAPPLIVGDRIIVGGGGGDRGAPGRIDALDAVTGTRQWRTDLVPAPGEAGRFGAGFLQTGVYDPAAGLTIWGVAHAFPRFDPPPGNTPFANSALALDVATGAIRWRHVYAAGPGPGQSEAGTHQLVATEEGESLVTHFGNDGVFYALDAATGALRSATPVLPNGVEAVPGCPNIRSVPAFAAAYSSRTDLAYGAGADGCDPGFVPRREGGAGGWLGAYYAGAFSAVGVLTAVNPATGAVAARRSFDYPLHSGVLATAGGLVFTATAEGGLHALDDTTLETIWTTRLATLSPLPPLTFEVDGEQFLAVVVGGNALAAGLTYRPPEMTMSENLFVLVVFGPPA